MNIDISKIVKVYSGKPGCMCGCVGKYSYNPEHRDLGSERRGYDVKDEEVSLRSVKIIAKKVLTNPDVKWDDAPNPEYAYVETDTRNLVVYFV